MISPMSAFPRAQRIVFLCGENACRSQMAEAFARRHGGPRVDVYSAGSRPASRINAKTIEFMAERGFSLAQVQPKSLADLPEEEFDVAVTLGCGDTCPTVRAKRREDWDLPDPKDMPPDDFRKIRDSIDAQVQELLARLNA